MQTVVCLKALAFKLAVYLIHRKSSGYGGGKESLSISVSLSL